jgi:molecular chaperone GrpE
MSNTSENETPLKGDEDPILHEEILPIDEMAKLQEELQMQKEKYLRSLAELENTKKRLQKERQEMTKFAVENVIIDFLNPLDNLEKALSFTDHMSDETKNWAIGFKMILTQLQDVLSEHHIYAFEAKGETFDPHLHEAVSIEETEAFPEGTILEQFSKGYKSSDRTLRPARVKVAKKPKVEAVELLEEPSNPS